MRKPRKSAKADLHATSETPALKPGDLQPGNRWLSREELYDLVWQEPMQLLAARFGLSDVGLAKKCRAMSIPIPPRGYWAKVKVGGKPPKPRLLKAPEVDQATEVHVVAPGEVKPPPKPKKREEATKLAKVHVAETLSHPHPLVELTRVALRSREGAYDAIARRNRPPQHHLDVRKIDKGSIGRALRILDALIKECELRGHGIYVEKGWSYVKVGRQRFKFYMDEVYERRGHVATEKEIARNKHDSWYKIPTHDWVSVGDLAFHLEAWHVPRTNWKDGKRQKLDEILDEVIEGIETAARIEQERDDAAEARRKIEAEARRRDQLVAQRKHDEATMLKWLVQDARKLERAKAVEAYIDAVEAQAVQRGMTGRDDVRRWLAWARLQLAEMHPLTDGIPVRDEKYDLPIDFGDGAE